MTFRLDAQCGKVDIECGLNKFERSRHFMPLLLRAQDIATASVQLAGFATGESLTIVLDSFTDPTGIATPIAAQRPADVTAKTWIVMNRFLEYLKRDGRDLPLSEFPLLT